MATSKGISETLSNLSFSGALVLVSAGTQGTFGAKISGTTGWCLIKKNQWVSYFNISAKVDYFKSGLKNWISDDHTPTQRHL